jgi:hypothetical protein
MFLKYYLHTCLLMLFCSSQLMAQTGSTPYSSQGFGYLQGPQLVSNSAMGGIGIANGSPFHINNINPALLYKNRFSSFDVAFTFEYKDMLRSGQTTSGTSAGLAYGVFAFPVIDNRWTSSIGLSPYSQVDFEREAFQPINGIDQEARLMQSGSGGLSKVFFSNGFQVVEGLGVGLKVGYLFGAIDTETSIFPLSVSDISLVTAYDDNIYYRGLTLEPGIHYEAKLGNNTSLNVGAVFQPETSLSATRLVTFSSRNPGQIDVVSRDTLISNEDGNAVLPQQIGVGLALSKTYKYKVGVDFTTRQWSEFGSYQAEGGNRTNDGLADSYTLAAGGEIIPDITSVSNYLARVSYRAGFRYSALPFQVGGTQINELAVSLGFSLPVDNLSSSLNIAVQGGTRGTTDNDLIRENFFRVQMGISFNDRWFIRRKFD